MGIVHGTGAEWMEHRFLPALRDTLERYFWLPGQGLDPAGWERLAVRHLALPAL